MKLSRRVRIGYRTFKVRALGRFARREYSGRTSRSLGVIAYDPTESPQEMANTLTHEVFHNILDIWCGMEGEEELTRGLSNGVVASMQDNPELWHWLIKQAGR